MARNPRRGTLKRPANPREKKPKPGPLALYECIPHAPKRIENPVFQAMNGKNYDDEGDCRDANMKFVLNMIVEHDHESHGAPYEQYPEDIVEFLLRNRGQLIVALCARGEAGGEDASGDVTLAFNDYMLSRFGRGWNENKSDDNRALTQGMREAFIAGQAWYVQH